MKPPPLGGAKFLEVPKIFWCNRKMKEKDHQQTTIAILNSRKWVLSLFSEISRDKKAAALAIACKGISPRRVVNMPQCHACCQGHGSWKGGFRLPPLHEHRCHSCSIGTQSTTGKWM